jgi:DNA-binding LacI/PurR family transcriptional regulator
MVTTRDIAREIGVSHQAVAAALKEGQGTVRVSAATRERVREAAARLGYDPEQQLAARRLVGQRYGQRVIYRRIALFFPPQFNSASYTTRMLQGIMQMTDKHDFDLVTTSMQLSPEASFPPCITRGEVDAAIMFTLPALHEELLRRFGAMKQFNDKPIVSLMHPLPGCTVVRANERQGAYLAARHLLNLGHRHLMHCYGDQVQENDFHACERVAGYSEALREQGFDPAEHLHAAWFYWDEGSIDLKSCSAALLERLTQCPQVTAILTINDQSASALTALLRRTGRSVPDEISIIGHDDTYPLYDSFQENYLTTVRLPLEEIGQEAVRHILERIGVLQAGNTGLENGEGESVSDETDTIERVLPVEFVERRSTAAPNSSLR